MLFSKVAVGEYLSEIQIVQELVYQYLFQKTFAHRALGW